MSSASTLSQTIAQRLAVLGSSNFATRFTVEADPQLHVVGVGEVPLPVTIHTAHRLCAVAQPAHHGYRDETRLDPRVRDTWEVPASAIGFASPRWQAVLDRALVRIGRELGLTAGASLDAQLHNLLVYAPGQFFAVHQDSEKADGMLGTLVVTLPSKFTGGEFVVSHQGQTLRARGSASRLGLLAFYADCHHEVRPVKQGYRVALTYNLIARGGVQPGEVPVQDISALASTVQTFWQTPAAPRWSGDTETEAPDRLVYLLDHQYTQSGLTWAHLKGADAVRAEALRKVAERLDAEIFLTLADVHETWSAEDDWQEADHWDYADDDDEGEEVPDTGPDGPALGELIDSDIELRHWLAPDGSVFESAGGGVKDAELCLTRASSDCTPFQSEYEGYMGNYGNTVDRWYHRAAVVMWPRERAFVIRARQAPGWAIGQIAARLKAGDEAQARIWVQSLLPFWKGAARIAGEAELFAAVLPVAAVLDDEDAAAQLLAPFPLQALTPELIPWLLRLLERHGLDWCGERLRQWAVPCRQSADHLVWLARAVPALTHACAAASAVEGKALAARLIEDRWVWLQEHLAQVGRYDAGSSLARSLANTAPALLGLMRGSRDACRPDLRQAIIDVLLRAELPLSLGVLRAAGAKPAELSDLGLATVHGHCLNTLAERLARPERARDDWSIPMPASLAGEFRPGELGEQLARFLESSAQRRLEWPLAKDKRQTIHRFIDRHELPVWHETRRTGRPYTLVLEKTQALFEHEAAARRQWSKDLAWLRKTAGGFAAVS